MSNLFFGFEAIQDVIEAFKRFENMASSDDVPESVFKQEEEEFSDPSQLPEADPDRVYVRDSYNPTRYFRLQLRRNQWGAYVDVMQVTERPSSMNKKFCPRFKHTFSNYYRIIFPATSLLLAGEAR